MCVIVYRLFVLMWDRGGDVCVWGGGGVESGGRIAVIKVITAGKVREYRDA